jgi:hypothetical protein
VEVQHERSLGSHQRRPEAVVDVQTILDYEMCAYTILLFEDLHSETV